MNCRASSCVSRFLAVAAVVVVALFTMPAHAQILNFTGGFSESQLCPPPTPTTGCLITVTAGDSTNNGGITGSGVPNVPVESSVLQLTQNLTNQRGAAWFNTRQQVAGGFGVEFQFQIMPSSETGDGFAFVIQNSSSGLAAIGGFGGGIGYGTREFDPCNGLTTAAQYSQPPCNAGSDLGIPNSIAIEFDTFTNSYDLDNDHVAIQSCGTLNNLADHTSPCLIARSESFGALPLNLADGTPHFAQIVYLPYTATCPTSSPCPNLSVYIDPGINPAPVVQAHVDLNNPCTAAGCPTGTILNNGAAYVGFTAATRGAAEEADILNFTFSPAITLPLQGSGVTNSFVFPFATYKVTYPADVPITNTTMTITPTVLPVLDCNARINIFPAPNNAPNNPTCTNTFPGLGTDAVIFDVACAVGANQTQGDTTPPGLACPTTSGFNPLQPTSTFHSAEDISNIVTYTGATIPSGVAPQFLTATEGTNAWVAIGVGFSPDLTKGGGTNNYQSQMVLADFPLVGGTSPFLVQYQFNGFTSPVNPPVINSAQAGQTIPFKWQLLYPDVPSLGFNGGPVTNLNLVVPPAAATTFPFLTLGVVGDCSSSSNLAFDDSIPVDTESQTGLMNQGNGFYQYNWKTPKVLNGMALAGQCVVVDAEVGDGQPHEADIQFHK